MNDQSLVQRSDDKLKAAAERFLHPHPPTAYPWPCEMYDQPERRAMDAEMLAFAYLLKIAERPEDDAEPTTVEWLRSLPGAIIDPDGNSTLFSINNGNYFAIESDLSAGVQSMLAFRDLSCTYLSLGAVVLKTRGDVRRFFTALGIKLTV